MAEGCRGGRGGGARALGRARPPAQTQPRGRLPAALPASRLPGPGRGPDGAAPLPGRRGALTDWAPPRRGLDPTQGLRGRCDAPKRGTLQGTLERGARGAPRARGHGPTPSPRRPQALRDAGTRAPSRVLGSGAGPVVSFVGRAGVRVGGGTSREVPRGTGPRGKQTSGSGERWAGLCRDGEFSVRTNRGPRARPNPDGAGEYTTLPPHLTPETK